MGHYFQPVSARSITQRLCSRMPNGSRELSASTIRSVDIFGSAETDLFASLSSQASSGNPIASSFERMRFAALDWRCGNHPGASPRALRPLHSFFRQSDLHDRAHETPLPDRRLAVGRGRPHQGHSPRSRNCARFFWRAYCARPGDLARREKVPNSPRHLRHTCAALRAYKDGGIYSRLVGAVASKIDKPQGVVGVINGYVDSANWRKCMLGF